MWYNNACFTFLFAKIPLVSYHLDSHLIIILELQDTAKYRKTLLHITV